MADAYVPRLRAKYDAEIAAAMTAKFGYKNKFEVPKIDKITLNMGVGEGTQDRKKVTTAAAEMEAIAGQKPVVTKAKKSVAQFKLREGMAIGCKVTLRRERMYEFLDRLITIAMPRIRDFRGLNPKSFDGRGNSAIFSRAIRRSDSSRVASSAIAFRCANFAAYFLTSSLRRSFLLIELSFAMDLSSLPQSWETDRITRPAAARQLPGGTGNRTGAAARAPRRRSWRWW